MKTRNLLLGVALVAIAAAQPLAAADTTSQLDRERHGRGHREADA